MENILGQLGTKAVRNLRIDKLSRGFLFMINSKELQPGYCFLEYPTGRIVLATLSQSKRDFSILRELDALEIASLRTRFGLTPLFEGN